MEKVPIDFIKDKNTQDLMNHIFDEAQGKTIELTAAPTTVGGELAPGQSGHYGTNLYINLGGTIYSLSLTAV